MVENMKRENLHQSDERELLHTNVPLIHKIKMTRNKIYDGSHISRSSNIGIDLKDLDIGEMGHMWMRLTTNFAREGRGMFFWREWMSKYVCMQQFPWSKENVLNLVATLIKHLYLSDV